MKLKTLHKLMCSDLDVEHHVVSDREFLSSRFQYADGDLVCAYYNEGRNGPSLTDRGNTLYKLKIRGLSLGENRIDLIRKLLAPHGVDLVGSEIVRPLEPASPQRSFIDFCIAVERVSTLEIQFAHKKPNYLAQMMDYLITERVEPARSVLRGWTSSTIDPMGAYPIDYYCNGSANTRCLFTVANREKGLLVSAVCNYFKAHNQYSPTLVVFDSDSPLPEKHVSRVRESVDEVVFGLSGFEDRVVDFALS